MRHLKFIHALLGILSLALFIGLSIVSPDRLSISQLQLSWNELSGAVLLATAISNLLLGCYISLFHKARRYLQLIASTLTMISVFTAINALLHPDFRFSGLNLEQITQFLLVLGVTLHFIINLNAINPYNHPVENDESRETGTVKWFNVTKGFGFITRDLGDDVFVHYRAIRGEGHRTLAEGQRVDFIVVKNDKGLQAEDVIAAAKDR